MGHSHTHKEHGDHAHHEHAHGTESPLTSEANVDLFVQVGNVGFFGLVFATYFMWFSGSHTAFGDVLHGAADVSTAYVMAYFARRHRLGKLTKSQTNRYAAIFNTIMLVAAAVGVWFDVQTGHRHTVDAWKLAGTAGILLVSNVVQFWMMHKMHGHEHKHDKHISMFSSTMQHFVSDILFDLGALVTAAAAGLFAGDAGHIDEYVASILVCILIFMAGKNIFKLIRHEELDLH
jgi:Co/Zn/Cd efflux system component